MGTAQKAITTTLWAVLVLVMVGVVVGQFWLPSRLQARHTTHAVADRPLFTVDAFSLTDQDGKPFTSQQLRGSPWVADLIFTSCAYQCRTMTVQMAQVQKATPASVKLVSFTVDPEHDTPAVLKAYAEQFHADGGRWHFLTGTRPQIDAAIAGLKLPVKPAEKDQPILHSEKFLLIDADGRVRDIYNGTDPDQVKRLIATATALAAEGSGKGGAAR